MTNQNAAAAGREPGLSLLGRQTEYRQVYAPEVLE